MFKTARMNKPIKPGYPPIESFRSNCDGGCLVCDFLSDPVSRPTVCCEDGFEAVGGRDLVSIAGGFDESGDVSKPDFLIQESGDSDFVCGIEYRGCGSTAAESLISQSEAWESIGVRGEKFKFSESCQVQRRQL